MPSEPLTKTWTKCLWSYQGPFLVVQHKMGSKTCVQVTNTEKPSIPGDVNEFPVRNEGLKSIFSEREVK